MAQYGGDQQYGRDNARQTDEYGNPIRRTDEYENIVRSAAGERYERDVRHVDEFGNTIHITEEYGINPGGTGHQGLGTNIDQVTGGTGQTDYHGIDTERRTMGDYGSTGQAQRTGTDAYGHQGLGAKIGQSVGGDGGQFGHQSHGTTDAYGSTGHQGLGAKIGQAIGGQTGHQSHGTERDTTIGEILHGDQGHHHGVGQATKGVGAGTGTDYASGGRSTGHQGTGTEIGSGGTAISSQKLHTATPLGGAGIGTGTKDVYPHGSTAVGDTHEKKGMMQKIKEKLPGGHETTTTGSGYGETHEKKGMIEKIKEKLPGHH